MDVDKELFLWSVLTGKQELALLFWARGKNKICKSIKFLKDFFEFLIKVRL
jgi:hypothetical protein